VQVVTAPVSFGVMERHAEEPRAPPAGGKVVLSSLPRGRSVICAPAPSLKLVLDGEETYEIDGQMRCVRPGQYLYLDAGSDCVAHLRQPSRGLCLLLPSSSSQHGHTDPMIGRAMVLPIATTELGRTVAGYARRIAREPRIGDRLAGELVEHVARGLAEPLVDVRAALDRLKASKPATR
jgi:hypothetical protein